MNADGPSMVRTTTTSVRIVEALQDLDGAGVTELATHLDISKSAVYKHLATLHRLGYVRRRGDTYLVGLKFLHLGLYARDRLPVFTVGSDAVERLADATGHTTSLMVKNAGYGVYVRRLPGHDEDPIREGDQVPLHATAAGKAILAFLDEADREAVLDRIGLSARTEKTITSRARLEKELRSIRDQRLSFDREEYAEGYQCVASPVVGSDGYAVGAVSVSGPMNRMTGKTLEEDVTGLVVSTAKSIENGLLSR
ncbi:IclR family transcriptional regulator [Halegenticoccus tardaugens]|uniref:IclR family transcriptional regulator n=1 Tax=Halegenticoccus tardaugens TaxID=2071624 RepID=UPI00100B489E|nr:IclR family transcriptional regulator [Halegenticoccus tardaugens]